MDKLPILLKMKYGTAGDAVKEFGGDPVLIKQTFTSFPDMTRLRYEHSESSHGHRLPNINGYFKKDNEQ